MRRTGLSRPTVLLTVLLAGQGDGVVSLAPAGRTARLGGIYRNGKTRRARRTNKKHNGLATWHQLDENSSQQQPAAASSSTANHQMERLKFGPPHE